MNNNKPNDGSVPQEVINKLIEHTLGGFILFHFNNETGEPEQVMTFDSPAHSLALQKYIADWSEAIHSVNIDSSVYAIRRHISDAAERAEDEDDYE